MPRKLRVAEPDKDKPRVLSIAEAAALNDHREMLVALRARIARSLEAPSVNPVALAALSRQMVLISKELSVLDLSESADPIAVAAVLPMRLGLASDLTMS